MFLFHNPIFDVQRRTNEKEKSNLFRFESLRRPWKPFDSFKLNVENPSLVSLLFFLVLVVVSFFSHRLCQLRKFRSVFFQSARRTVKKKLIVIDLAVFFFFSSPLFSCISSSSMPSRWEYPLNENKKDLDGSIDRASDGWLLFFRFRSFVRCLNRVRTNNWVNESEREREKRWSSKAQRQENDQTIDTKPNELINRTKLSASPDTNTRSLNMNQHQAIGSFHAKEPSRW